MSDSKKINDATRTVVLSQDEVIKEHAPEDFSESGGTLILIHGEPQGKTFNLDKDVMIIGRGQDAEIQILENGVSRRHTKLIKTPNGMVVQDLGSTNGTYVNDERINQVKLKKDDVIGIGVAVLKYLPPGSVEIKYHRRLSDAATTDPLTGINNKGYLMEALETEFSSHVTRGEPLSLIVIDLDHFKMINDTHGHDCGDMVLKEAVQIVRQRGVRNSDILGRYGGEEFVVILPKTPQDLAVEVAERIRSSLEAHPFSYEKTDLKVTASCGVATYLPGLPVKDHIAFFKLADRAVYQAKNSGRNRVCFAAVKKK